MGMEAFVFCSLLGIILFIGGVISLYDAVINPVTNNDRSQQPLSTQASNEQVIEKFVTSSIDAFIGLL